MKNDSERLQHIYDMDALIMMLEMCAV